MWTIHRHAAKKNFTFGLGLFFLFSIVLNFADQVFDFRNGLRLIHRGYVMWGWATIGLMLAPLFGR
jgi:hypothetical protein